MATPQYRPHDTTLTRQPDGSLLYQSTGPLGPVARRTIDWLDHWAGETPDAVFLAERSGPGWHEVSFAEARQTARAIAAGLLDLGLGPDRPILIVSGNSVAHGVLSLAAQYVGIPFVPIAEQYALIPEARVHLDHAAELIRPGAIFAEDGARYADALTREAYGGASLIVASNPASGMHSLDDLARTSGDITNAANAVGPDTTAKILMTSGSTSAPKGVVTTHRMMCTNQAQIAQCLPFLSARPPRIVDWLPWNHVFGGSHNFNLMLANGGALYIDGGKPAPGLVDKTIGNLRLQTGTISFNVPIGFAKLRDVMREDAALRQAFFQDLDMLFYAGASLPQDVWADLEDMAREVRGDVPLFTSSWGLTETAPAALLQHEPTDRSGVVGVPLPGVEVKLIPDADMRCEVRVRGPSIFSRYHENPAQTAAAFDADGFFRTGDAMVFLDPDNPNLGLRFDGRLSEDFKLQTGIWVRAANLRLAVLAALGGVAMDVIITGADREEVGLLIVPSPPLRTTPGVTEQDGALIVPGLTDQITPALAPLAGGSSTTITRCLVLAEPPQLTAGEITAKGNLNFSKLLKRRAHLLDRLYDDADPATILIQRDT